MPRHSRTRLSALGLAFFSLTLEAPVAALAQPRPYLDWPGKTPAPETAPATPLQRALPNAATGQPGFDIPPSPYGQVGNPYRSELNWRGKVTPDVAQAPVPQAAQAAPRTDLASNWTPQPQSRFDAPRRPVTAPTPQAPVPAQPAPQSGPQPAPRAQPTLRNYVPAPQAQIQTQTPPPVPDHNWIPSPAERVQSPPATNPAYGWIPSPSERVQEARRAASPAAQPPRSLPQPRLANPAPLPEPTPPVVSAETVRRETAPSTAAPQPQPQVQPQAQAPQQPTPDSGYRLPPNSKYAGRVSPELEARAAAPTRSAETRSAAPVPTEPSAPKAADNKASDAKTATAPAATAPLAQAAEQESAEPYTPFVPGSRATSPSQAPRFYSLHRAYGYEPDPAPHSSSDLALDPNAVQTPAPDKAAPKATSKAPEKTVKSSKNAPATEGDTPTSHPKPAKDKTL